MVPTGGNKIDEVYSHRAMLPEVTKLLRASVMCPVTGNSISLQQRGIYLVPIE